MMLEELLRHLSAPLPRPAYALAVAAIDAGVPIPSEIASAAVR
jgi:hypothetical protein